MSRPDLTTVLDECVSRLRRGEAPESCLADYPAHAGALAPDLALSAGLLQLSPLRPSAEGVASGYQRMMAAFDSREKSSRPAGLPLFINKLLIPFKRRQPGAALTWLRAAAIAVLLLVVSGGFVITASAESLPGDVLYPVKRSWENTRLALTIDESSRQTLQTEFERRRREEVQAVLDLGKPVVVEFKGVLESAALDLWLVDGLAVTVTADTKIDGSPSVGQKITVRAEVKGDGSLVALKIAADESRPPATGAPSRLLPPTQTPLATREPVGTTPTAPAVEPQPERTAVPSATPALSDATRIRPDEATPTPTHKPTERAGDEPTSTSTHAPSLDREPTREPTRDVRPTSTPSTGSLATALPTATDAASNVSTTVPTATPANHEPTPTVRPTTDKPPPTPTATSQLNRDPTPTHEPTATRHSDSGDRNDHPP